MLGSRPQPRYDFRHYLWAIPSNCTFRCRWLSGETIPCWNTWRKWHLRVRFVYLPMLQNFSTDVQKNLLDRCIPLINNPACLGVPGQQVPKVTPSPIIGAGCGSISKLVVHKTPFFQRSPRKTNILVCSYLGNANRASTTNIFCNLCPQVSIWGIQLHLCTCQDLPESAHNRKAVRPDHDGDTTTQCNPDGPVNRKKLCPNRGLPQAWQRTTIQKSGIAETCGISNHDGLGSITQIRVTRVATRPVSENMKHLTRGLRNHRDCKRRNGT